MHITVEPQPAPHLIDIEVHTAFGTREVSGSTDDLDAMGHTHATMDVVSNHGKDGEVT